MQFFVSLIICLPLWAFDYTLPPEVPSWIQSRQTYPVFELRQRLKNDPSDPEALLLLAYEYLKKGDASRCANYASKALNKKITHSMAYLLLARARILQERWEEAKKLSLHALLNSDQQGPEYYTTHTYVLFMLGDYTQSLHFLKLGLGRHPESFHLGYLWALNQLALGNLHNAEPQLIKMKQLEPEEPAIYYNLACIYAFYKDLDGMYYNLRYTAKAGYRKIDTLLQEEDFQPFHQEPRFKLVVQEIYKNIQKLRTTLEFQKI